MNDSTDQIENHENDSASSEASESTAAVESNESAPAPTVTREEISDEEFAKMAEKAAKADENWDRFLRLNAEFDNYKKRAARDRAEAVKYANEALIEQLLPTLDHFDMALAATEATESVNLDAIKTGVKMVHDQLRSILSEWGLADVEASGAAFDPSWHEAVSQEETEAAPEGTVLRQMRKGYKLKDRLLRAASVVVAKAPGASTESASQDESADS